MEANKIDLGIQVGNPDSLKHDIRRSKQSAERYKSTYPKNITPATVEAWIDEQDYPKDLRDHLVKLARSRPDGALLYFLKNIGRYVASFKR